MIREVSQGRPACRPQPVAVARCRSSLSRVSRVISRLRRLSGIDFHIGVTLMLRGWTIVAGAITVVVIASSLSALQQGYYFTFASLLGIQVFFELGLGQVVVQIVSHEMAFLNWDDNGELLEKELHLDRVRSIIKLLRRWYALAAVLFATVAILAGSVLFKSSASLPLQLWAGPWITLVLVTSVNLYYAPMLAVVEGCGRIGQVARLRLVQSMIGYALTWLALSAGGGLWAVTLVGVSSAACTLYWLRIDSSLIRVFDGPSPIPPERSVNWSREVLPFQWRIGVSWISGYLMFQLFTPLVFVHLGPVEAGRLGIALAIFNALLSLGVSWINAKIPLLTAQISRGERTQLNATFAAVLLRATAATATLSAFVLIGVYLLRSWGVRHVERIADLPTLACIATTTSITVVIYGIASYMRAHRQEPMLPLSIVCGLVTLFGVYVASRDGVFATMLVQMLVTALISLPWTLALFRSYYRRGST